MQINIKQLILEGYSYEEITEAVHANHPDFNKKTALSIDRNKLKDRIIEARRDSRFMKNFGDIKHSNFSLIHQIYQFSLISSRLFKTFDYIKEKIF